jgi:diguanylate cyclase
LAIDLAYGGGIPPAAIVVSRGATPLSPADRALVELTARLLTTLADAQRRVIDAQRLAAEAAADAETDLLTGLPNRRGWSRRMAELDQKRPPDGRSAILLVVDIEGLKEVNDRRGYAAGDDLLRRAATALGAAHPVGFAARIGGDEFVVWNLAADGQTIDETVGKVRQALESAGVAAAIGGAMHDGTRSTAQTFDEADRRMTDEKMRKREA